MNRAELSKLQTCTRKARLPHSTRVDLVCAVSYWSCSRLLKETSFGGRSRMDETLLTLSSHQHFRSTCFSVSLDKVTSRVTVSSWDASPGHGIRPSDGLQWRRIITCAARTQRLPSSPDIAATTYCVQWLAQITLCGPACLCKLKLGNMHRMFQRRYRIVTMSSLKCAPINLRRAPAMAYVGALWRSFNITNCNSHTIKTTGPRGGVPHAINKADTICLARLFFLNPWC